MKVIRELYEEFIESFPHLPDFNHTLQEPFLHLMQSRALMENKTNAVFYPGSDEYLFLFNGYSEFFPVLHDRISVGEFFSLVYPGDISHFRKAWRSSFEYLASVGDVDIADYAVVFECRLRNQWGKYMRTLFRYTVQEIVAEPRQHYIIMSLLLVGDPDQKSKNDAVYLVDMKGRRLICLDKKKQITNREIEVLRMGRYCESNARLADHLFVSGSTIKFHHRNICEKLQVCNATEAQRYLELLGL